MPPRQRFQNARKIPKAYQVLEHYRAYREGAHGVQLRPVRQACVELGCGVYHAAARHHVLMA